MEFGLADGYSLVSCVDKKQLDLEPITPSAGRRASMASIKSFRSKKSKSTSKLHMTSHVKDFRKVAQDIYHQINKPCLQSLNQQETIEQLDFLNQGSSEKRSSTVKETRKSRRSQSIPLFVKESLLQSIPPKE